MGLRQSGEVRPYRLQIDLQYRNNAAKNYAHILHAVLSYYQGYGKPGDLHLRLMPHAKRIRDFEVCGPSTPRSYSHNDSISRLYPKLDQGNQTTPNLGKSEPLPQPKNRLHFPTPDVSSSSYVLPLLISKLPSSFDARQYPSILGLVGR